LEIDPLNVDALNNLGVILFRQKLYNDAFKYLSKAVKIDPQRDYIHNNLGMLYTEMGMHAEAKGEFEKAVELADRSQ